MARLKNKTKTKYVVINISLYKSFKKGAIITFLLSLVHIDFYIRLNIKINTLRALIIFFQPYCDL